MKTVTIIIAAGGTGGHLIPALEIARALKERAASSGADLRVEFVGSGRPLEEQLVDKLGFARHVVPIVGVKRRGLKGLLEFGLRLPKALLVTWRLISKLKPSLVMGIGGYVSVLPVTLAAVRGIPTWIHEAEIRPGLANWFLMHFASRVSTAFQDARVPRRRGTEFTGHPVRQKLCDLRAQIRPHADAPRRLLVLGGSQGARAIDDAMCSLCGFLKERGLEVRHQARPERVAELQQAYERFQVAASVSTFIDDMAEAYSWADIVVGRAGASAMMEIEALNIPAVLVPYPFAAENHQLANARVLERAGKVIVVEEGDNFPPRLRHAIELLLDPDRYALVHAQPHESRSLTAASKIAELALQIAKA